MPKIRFHIRYLAGALIIMGLFSCNKDKDTENPTLSITAPYENQMFVQGGQFSVKATLTDNEELSECKIDISPFAGNKDTSWDTTFTIPLSGKSFTLDEKFKIPPDATTGDYKILLLSFDKEGNEGSASQKFRIAFAR